MEILPNELLEIILNHLSASNIDIINFGRAYNFSNVNDSRIFNFILYYFLRRLKLKSKIKLIEPPTENFILSHMYYNWVNDDQENHINEYARMINYLKIAQWIGPSGSPILRYSEE